MNYSYRPPDMDVRVIMSRLDIKLGCQMMGMFLIVVFPFCAAKMRSRKKKSGCVPVDERRKRGFV